MRGVGAMAAIETAYRLDVDTKSWLQELAALVSGTLGDPGLHHFGAIYRSHETGFTYDAHALSPNDDELMRAIARLEALNPKHVSGQKYRKTVCETSSEMARSYRVPGAFARLLIRRTIGRWGYGECIQVQGSVLDNVAVGVTVGLRGAREIPSRVRHTWERVAIHMAAALRLRSSLQQHGPLLARSGLVLERGGAVAHADAELAEDKVLRERLLECARQVDAARGHLSTDAPEQAVQMWQGLFEGRWSVLEVHDTDGRSYVIACENDPAVTETRALTRRERQVVQLAARGQANDLIAYTLGISPSSVQTHLARGLAKTGIKTRAKLIRAAATLDARFAKGDR